MANDRYAGRYKLVKASIINTEGNSADIRNLIKEFEIHESINMMFAVYSFHVIDAVSLLENMGATGSERMSIEILMDDTDTLKTIDLSVINYGSYKRPTNQSQSYTITAINETAMHSNVKRISRSVNGSACEIIRTLYDEINQGESIKLEDASDEGNFKGIIPNLTYGESFSYLISKAQTTTNGMFFFFETYWGGQKIDTYKNMISSKPIREYVLTDNVRDGNDGNFNKNTLVKIKNIYSDFGMSAFKAFKEGGVTSTTHMIDTSTKEYESLFFNSTAESLPKFKEDYIVSKDYQFPLDDTAGTYYVTHRNHNAYDQKFENFNQHMLDSLPKKTAQFSNLFAMTHKIDITGTDDLACGKTLELNIQQATDPTIVDVHKDEMLSGPYLITEIVHKFNSTGVYHASVTVKKDSFDRKLMMRGGLF